MGVYRGARSRRATYRRRRLAAAIVLLAAAVLAGFVLASGGGSQSRTSARAHTTGVRDRARGRAAYRSARNTAARPSLAAQEQRTNEHVLAYTSYIAVGVPHKREIALTFDDGPGPFTVPILRVLERFHVKATFFEIGREVRAYPRLTERVARAGMAIGDHTETHPPLAALGESEQASEVDEAARAIAGAGAPRPTLFRPPYGSFDATTLGLLRARKMVMVLWTVDTSDYERPGVQQIVYTALSGARPGAIILFHDGGGDRSQTVAALPRIIERLLQRGYRLVTVPELLRDDPPPVGQPPPVNLSGAGSS
jgi:peptidoglycan-N-acetylglucosamine deacetylase